MTQKIYEFLVSNNRVDRLYVKASNKQEALEKLQDFDIEEEEVEQDDYDFDSAELVSVEEIEEEE